jgi:MFS family permease
MLSHGVLMGMSLGLQLLPAMGAVSHYFDKKRAAAMGLSISGSSIGGVVMPIVLSKLLNDTSLGFGWTLRIIGFILAGFLTFSCVVIKARLPPRHTRFFIGEAFKNPRYNLLVFSMFLLFFGMFTPLFYIPTYAVSRGMDVTLASYLLAILNGASTFGRIIPGVLADKFGRINVLSFGGISTSIIVFCLNKVETTPALIVYSVLVGFTSGTLISGGAVAISSCVNDPREMGSYMGMGMALAGLASLIGPPLNGFLITRYGGFFEVSILSGVMGLVGGCVALFSKTKTPEGIFGRV